MTISVSSPVTGSAQTGFTAPTYTLVAGTAPELNQKQWDVSALGGTQAGVAVSSVSLPFTVTVSRPKVLKTLGTPNPVTGIVSNIPRNVYGVLTRKGVQVMSGGVTPPVPMIIRTTIEVPAGADIVDPSSIRAALSLHVGTLSQVSAGAGDTTISGTF
jgi:hypothetical protein